MRITVITRQDLDTLLTEEEILPDVGIQKAIQWAEYHHGPQVRLGGGSVLEEHIFPICADVVRRSREKSIEVRRLLASAALLHDVVEDCGITLQAIQDDFGPSIAELVELLTDKGKTIEAYFGAIAKSMLAALIKVCDRRNNLASFEKVPERKLLLPYCDETDRFVMPLANALGGTEPDEMATSVAALRAVVAPK